jgi:uncharacterized membrane protein (UPF0127 family)
MMLLNRRTGATIASAVELAATRNARRRGLLGRDRLDPSAALILTPCFSIHTAFMRFAIDVAFVDRDGGVLRVVHELPPWRLAWSPGAHAAVELAAGSLRSSDLLIGDALDLAPALDSNRIGPPTRARATHR